MDIFFNLYIILWVGSLKNEGLLGIDIRKLCVLSRCFRFCILFFYWLNKEVELEFLYFILRIFITLVNMKLFVE